MNERPFNTDYHAKTTSRIWLLCDVTYGQTPSADHLVSSFMDDPKIFPIKNTNFNVTSYMDDHKVQNILCGHIWTTLKY